jgi:flavodoxin
MKIAVISYSLTANNKAFANSIAEKFAADHINIQRLNLVQWVQSEIKLSSL